MKHKKAVLILAACVLFTWYVYCHQISSDLYIAIKNHDDTNIEKLLDKPFYNVNVPRNMWQDLFLRPGTPFQAACMHGTCDEIEQLLIHGAWVNLRIPGSDTPLCCVISGDIDKRADAVDLLIRHNANYDKLSLNGEHPLYLAASASVYDFDEETYTLKYNELNSEENLRLYKAIYKCALNKDPILESTGENTLMCAARNDNIDIVEWILENTEVDVNKKDKDGRTALFLEYIDAESNQSAEPGREIIALLLKNGADPTIRDDEGKTAYDYVKEQGASEYAELLKVGE